MWLSSPLTVGLCNHQSFSLDLEDVFGPECLAAAVGRVEHPDRVVDLADLGVDVLLQVSRLVVARPALDVRALTVAAEQWGTGAARSTRGAWAALAILT